MYLSKKKKIYHINNFKNKITNKIYNNLTKTLKKYKKNKKLKNNKKRKSKKILKKNRHFAKGKEHEMVFLIQHMLDKTSKNSHGKEFYDKYLMKKIMSNIPIQDIKTAIRRFDLMKRRLDLMKSYAVHLEEKKVKVEKFNKEIHKNEDLLVKKKEELKKRNALGEDGPSRRTRSQGFYNKDTKIQDLEKEITDLTRSIDTMKFILKKLTKRPDYLTNY